MVYVSELNYQITQGELKKIDKKYLDLPTNLATTDDMEEVWGYAEEAFSKANNAYDLADSKMDKNNPVGTGSFSMNQKNDTAVGKYSSTLGRNSAACGECSSTNGLNVVATGWCQNVEGKYNIVDEYEQNTNGPPTWLAIKKYYYCSSSYTFNPFTGIYTLDNPKRTYLTNTNLTGQYLCSEKSGSTIYLLNAAYMNFPDPGSRSATTHYSTRKDTYAHIVGNGTSEDARSNAHTLDWEGNAWFQGDVYVGSTSGTNKDEGSKKLATEDSVHNILIATGLITPEDIDAICGVTT
jgi:hypothetical protein